MREEEKPFLCYKSGWSMKIVPRNAEGWRSLTAWLIGFALMVAAELAITSTLRTDSARMALLVVFLASTFVWTFALIRWLLARSEVIDLRELKKRDAKRAEGRK